MFFLKSLKYFIQLESRKPWANPNAASAVPAKKFRVSLNHKPLDSKVSRKAPFGGRPLSSASCECPKVVNGKVAMPHYSSLDDPHLNDYFARKLGIKPKLSDGNSLKVISYFKCCYFHLYFFSLGIDTLQHC